MLEAAHAKRIITPQGSVPIQGHAMRKSPSTGVHDELEVHVLFLNLEGTELCFINADLAGIDFGFGNRVKTAVRESYGIDEELTVFSTTHTHSGPVTTTGGDHKPDPEYMDMLFERTMEAVQEAYTNRKPFDHVTYRQDEVIGFYGNRNGRDLPGDQTVTILEFRDAEEHVVEAFVNMACHSTVNSPLELNLSADLLGNVRRELTLYLGVEPVMSNGAAGDMSNRLYRHNNDFAELKRVTVGIAARAAGFPDTGRLYLTDVRHRTVSHTVDYDTDKSGLEEKKAELEAKLETAVAFDDRKWLLSEIAGCERKLKVDHVHICLDSTIIRLGELELVVIPCELASAFGKQIKSASNAKVCLIWGYSNGHSTYIVEAKGFNGGHDGISTQLKRGQAEEYVGKLIQALY